MNEKSSSSVESRVLKRFQLSTYLTVTIACICLVYSEWDLMPEIGLFAVVTAGLVLIAYLVEGKWSLSIRAANVVGGLIAGIAGIWAAYLTVRPSTGLLRSIPWPTSMLPFLGPFLMILLPAKLFRPKHVGDYWGVHFIGLVCVALACTLADDAPFAVFLAAYLLCGTWSLALFLLYRNREPAPAADHPVRLPRVAQVARWAFPIFGVAVIGFLWTPRSGNIWQLGGDRNRIETGASEDAAIDLNGAGNLELNRDVAFEVYVEDNDGRPKLDLDPNQRWRGPTYRYYYNGRWTSTPPGPANGLNARAAAMAVRAGDGGGTAPAYNVKLPSLAPDQFFLTYQLRDQLRFPYLAAPIVFPPGTGSSPVIQLHRGDRASAFFATTDGGLRPMIDITQPGRGRYKQVTRLTGDPTASSPVALERTMDPALTVPPPIPAMTDWTMRRLRRLADVGAVPAAAFDERTEEGYLHPQNHEALARGLERFLASSGEYKYSLDLHRTHAELDPVEDFLLHTKVGPCTRFASALAAMLRAVRIPCLVVQGFRGADSRGDGHYDVRQCHAHAWVEVLVQRREPPPAHGQFMGRDTWHWVTLDPTPADESREAAADANIWWNSTQWTTGRLFTDLILNYSPERRDETIQLVWEAVTDVWSAFQRRVTAPGAEGFWARLALGSGLTIVSLPIILLARRRVRRGALLRHRSADAATAFYRRLLGALARRGWNPAPSDTPLEFAAAVAPRLPDADAVALVDRVTALFYRVRFGAVPLAPDETRQIDDGLTRLAARLAAN